MDVASVQAILFDKDGTLFDFQKSWGPWAAGMITQLSGGDAEISRALCHVLGFDLGTQRYLPDSFAVASTPDEQIARIVPLVPHLSAAQITYVMTPNLADALPVPVRGLSQSLQHFQGHGVKLGVVTNDFETLARAHLKHAGVASVFDVVIGFDSGFGGKPDPAGCLAALGTLGVAPEHTLMVGDSLHDIDAGAAAGMRTVGVLTGTATRQDLVSHADCVLEDIFELADLFEPKP